MFLLRNRNIKKVETKKESKKFDLKSLVWIGFNYTCGMAFPLSFATIIYGESGKGIGLWVFLVLLLGSLLAAIMGYAFSKMSKVYIKSNGATYAYVRASFGRFLGWIIGALQYVALPISSASYILSMISINLSEFVNWGKHEELYLNLIGIGVYLISAVSIFFGLKYFKVFLNLSGVIKWVSGIFIIVCALALDGLSHFSGFSYAVNKTQGVTNNHFFSNFNDAFVSLFYFYAGFETYTTIAKNVKNPARTMPRAILWITTLTLLFYVIVTVCFIGVQPDPNAESWFTRNPPLDITRMAAGMMGAVFVIASMISLKLNASMQSSLYASGMLEPLAVEHYISPSFSKLNKDRISTKSAVFNISLTTVLTLLLICLPSLILYNQNNPNIDYTQLLAFTTIIIFIQYILVLLAIFHLYMKKLILLLTIEKIAFSFVFIFLMFELGNYFYEQFVIISSNLGNIDGIFSLVSIIIFVVLVLASCLIYKFHYVPIYERRMKNNPELQKELDKGFEISGYAKLEMELYKRKVETINALKEERKINLDKLSSEEIKTEKQEYKKQKNGYLLNLNSKLKELKLEYKKNIKQIKDLTHNKKANLKMKNKYISDIKSFKKDSTLSKSDLNSKLKELKLEYKENLKTIKHPKDDFEIINNLYNEYSKEIYALKDKKILDLIYLKENVLKYFAIKNSYLKSKRNLISEIEFELENYIDNISDDE